MKKINILLVLILGIALMNCKKKDVDPRGTSSITIVNRTGEYDLIKVESPCGSLNYADAPQNNHGGAFYIKGSEEVVLSNDCGGTQTLTVWEWDKRDHHTVLRPFEYTLHEGEHLTHFCTY